MASIYRIYQLPVYSVHLHDHRPCSYWQVLTEVLSRLIPKLFLWQYQHINL